MKKYSCCKQWLWVLVLLFMFPFSAKADSVEQYGTFNGHFYHIYNRKEMVWNDAVEFCESKGGYLASITSPEENNYIYGFINSQDVSNVLFGLSDQSYEGKWAWQNGEPLSYSNWNEGEPNGDTNENYGMYADDGKWNDGYFDVDHFLCEWNTEPEELTVLKIEAEAGKQEKKVITFGEYPQSKVSDGNIIKNLVDSEKIYSYDEDCYIVKWNGTKYIHVNWGGEYWFKFEPIRWLVYDNGGSQSLVLSELIINEKSWNNEALYVEQKWSVVLCQDLVQIKMRHFS